MASLSERIMDNAATLPEAGLICPGTFLHLGNRAAVDQALSRLARAGRLLRVWRGVYVRYRETRWGPCPPGVHEILQSVAALWGETIVPAGGSAANVLGLTTQNPIRSVYLTSGPSRRFSIGRHPGQLRHAPRWQLVAPYRPAGNLIRAFTFLHRYEIEEVLEKVIPGLSAEDRAELRGALKILPSWLARPIGTFLAAT